MSEETTAAEATPTLSPMQEALAVLQNGPQNDDTGGSATGSEANENPGQEGANPPDVATAPADNAAEVKAAEPVADPVASKFEALAREHRRIREETEALKAERARVEALLKEDEIWKQDPLEALRRKGLSYEQLTDLVLTGKRNTRTPTDEVKETVQSLQQQIEALRAERAREREESNARMFKAQVDALAKSAADKYELFLSEPDYDRVYQTIYRYHKENGDLPGGSEETAIAWALDKIEQAEEKRLESRLTLKKAQSKVSGIKAATSGPEIVKGKQSPKTLTNSTAGAPPRSVPQEPTTREEYLQAALEALRLGPPK